MKLETAQTIGELLNGCIDFGECTWFLESDYCMDALSYFLTQYKGKLDSINCGNISDKFFVYLLKVWRKEKTLVLSLKHH